MAGEMEGGESPPLVVLTVYRSGGVFTPEYVTRLRDGVAANLSTPHRFVCLSDVDVPGVETIPPAYGWPGWWSKVEIFRPDLPFGRVLYIDLSSVAVGSLDEMAAQSGIVITKDWYYGGPSQSVLLYDVGDFQETWLRFLDDPEGWMRRGDERVPPDFGDQILMNRTPVPTMRYWQDVLPGQVVSFKVHGNPPGARLVKFHGRPKPHEVNWLEPVTFSATLNNSQETMLAQAHSNARRGLPWFEEKPENSRAVALVAGGPSLADEILRLRFLDADVVALNGAHDYLIDRGIVPKYAVVLDSREENAAFVRNPNPDTTYLIAAVCHPAVLDALAGHRVVLWANDMDGLEVDAPVRVGGGATVGMKAMYLAYLDGYRDFHLFGFDSCYRDERNHAYPQPLNDGEARMAVHVAGRSFTCAPWMVKQAREFQQQARTLLDLGCAITVHGDGLIAHVADCMTTPQQAA